MAAKAAPKKAAKAEAPPEVFDVDAAREEFKPVRVRFHGKEYALGTTALGLVSAPDLFAGEDGDDSTTMQRMLKRLPEALALLNPSLGEAVEEHGLVATEEVLLIRALTEVMVRVGTFRSA